MIEHASIARRIVELAERAATQRSGQDLDAWMAAHDTYARGVMASGRFPLVTRAWLDAAEPHAADRAERVTTPSAHSTPWGPTPICTI
ncbi:hypothetical protein [Nocardia terpenica]|uniref:hypothetical protein n=1 Tax=Nocardia terpenica TaxID=455432 RepID=UPI0018853530|nr:hypothetical protein [Nocardia terpenica]